MKIRESKVKQLAKRMNKKELNDLLSVRVSVRSRLVNSKGPKKAIAKSEQMIAECEAAIKKAKD